MKSKKEDEQTIKTAQLVGVGVVATLLACCIDERLGLVSTLATCGLIYSCHETGKNRRPIANGAEKVGTFFGLPSNTIETIKDNVIEGGAAYHDEISSIIAKPHSK